MAYKIVIDPGHNPADRNTGNNGYYEYYGMWKLSSYLKDELEKKGFDVSLTRRETLNPSLVERGEQGRGADLFISEHSNAYNGTARGVEVFYSVKRPEDKIFADAMAKNISTLMGNPDLGGKTRESTQIKGDDYYTVINTAANAGAKHILLVENGFHDNVYDEAFLMDDENLRKLAKVQAETICSFFNVDCIDLYSMEGNGLKVIYLQ